MTKKNNTAAVRNNTVDRAGVCPSNKTNNKVVGFNDFPQETIRYLDVVKAMALNEGLQMADAEDRKSYAACHAVKARYRFKKTKGASETTFLHIVIDDSVIDSKRTAMRMKRTKEVLSLDRKIVDTDGCEGEEREIDRVADERDDGLTQTDLRLDVETIVSTLTPVQKKVCKLLQAGVLKRDIPALTGITEHEFKYKIMPALAKFFAEFEDS